MLKVYLFTILKLGLVKILDLISTATTKIKTNSFKDHIIVNKKRKVKHALKSFNLGFRLEWVQQGHRQFPYSHFFHDPG